MKTLQIFSGLEKSKWIFLYLIFISPFFFQSCTDQSEKQDCSESENQFNIAKKTNTLSAYQYFLENFSTCQSASLVRQLIDTLVKPIQEKSTSLNKGERWEFGDRYLNNITITVFKKDSTTEKVPADLIAQESALSINSFNDSVYAEVVQIQICKKLVFKIPDSLYVDNTQWLLRPKEIVIKKIDNNYVFPDDKTEVPAESGLKNGEFYFNYWNQAIGASWKFDNKVNFETKKYIYKVTSTPAWIMFTKYGVELKNIIRNRKDK